MATTAMQARVERMSGVSRSKGNRGFRRSRSATKRDAFNFYRRKSSGGSGG